MHCMRKNQNSRGQGKGQCPRIHLRGAFTLIEMLIVTVILSVVSLAIYSTFSSGIRIWKRVSASPAYEDQAIFFDRLGHDLRNAVALQAIPLMGSDEQLEFPVIADSPRMKVRTVARTSYVYEPGSGAIKRWQDDYSAIFTGRQDLTRTVLSGVADVKISYYFFNKDEKEFAWADRWTQADFPLAVRVELEFDAAHGGGSVIRTFAVPARRTRNYEN